MPEQDNWKEGLERWKDIFIYHVSLDVNTGFIKTKGEMLDDLDKLFSSQAHALKEQMKAELGMYIKGGTKITLNKDCFVVPIEILSAIESIEI